MAFEHSGEAILGDPMQIGMDGETRGPVLFNGKGRINLVPTPPITADKLNGRWRILAINGQATPGTPDYQMTFATPHWRGGLGCNGMMAEFRIENGQLWIGRTDGQRFVRGSFIATERDCSEQPTGHFEYEGVPIIRQPMMVEITYGSRMKLSNPAGSFDLERVR